MLTKKSTVHSCRRTYSSRTPHNIPASDYSTASKQHESYKWIPEVIYDDNNYNEDNKDYQTLIASRYFAKGEITFNEAIALTLDGDQYSYQQ